MRRAVLISRLRPSILVRHFLAESRRSFASGLIFQDRRSWRTGLSQWFGIETRFWGMLLGAPAALLLASA